MNRFGNIFKCCLQNKTAIIGMIHVKSLPMSPLNELSVEQLVEMSCKETEIYKKYKLDAICVENMFDIPYVKRKDSGPEVTAIMTRVCTEVKKCIGGDVPVGVQLLAGLNHEALAVALASGLDFIRCESFVFGHIADEGYMEGCAGSLLRYRKQLNANHILILTDIKKKHSSHAITSDVDLVETGKAAQFFLSDGLIITGLRTGHLPDLQDIYSINQSNMGIPVLIGSGVNHLNVKQCIESNVTAVIVGSDLKVNGVWSEELSPQRVERFMQTVNQIYDCK